MPNSNSFSNPKNGVPIPLWPGVAPGAEPEGFQPTITPYLIPSSPSRGIVLVLPGGGYGTRVAHESEVIARFLNSIWFSAAVVDYRVNDENRSSPLGREPLMDCQQAIRLVRHHHSRWQVRPDRVAVIGFSAGGHLAATAGTQFDDGDKNSDRPEDQISSRPDAMILCYAVTRRWKGGMKNLLGDNPSEEDMAFFDCENRVTEDTPPAFIWHTAEDQVVPVDHSIRMAEAMLEKSVPVELHIFPKGGHGLALANNDPCVGQWKKLCKAWLESLGF
jgi:acetyl esterase/lipase